MTELEQAEALRKAMCRETAQRTLEALERGELLRGAETELERLTRLRDIESYQAGMQAMGIEGAGLTSAALELGIRAGYLTALVTLAKRNALQKRLPLEEETVTGLCRRKRARRRRRKRETSRLNCVVLEE